jgi:hypothetical protein
MSGHTPGPWKACGCGKCGQVSCSDHPVCKVERGDWGDSAEMVYGHIPIEEGDANARLIAAAPDLLEALKCVEWVMSGSGPRFCSDCGHDRSRGHAKGCSVAAAIAKAEGK